MNLINGTKMQAGYTLGLDKDGRESVVVVVKGTFLIPSNPVVEPQLAAEQAPLVTADEFTGEPGFSAALYESDYAPRKPRCDVLLIGSAYAPGGRTTERVTVSLRVGSLAKSFDVVGKRTWSGGVLGFTPSQPEKFAVQPISYNVAFGGIDKTVSDPAKQKTYLHNHVGIGYHDNFNAAAIVGQPLPNTEETGKPVTSPRGNYKPMAFGPLARVSPDRVKFAGTYDKKWLDDVSPFLPSDFDERYFQAAPADQQMDYLQGGEEVELLNLTPDGRTVLKVPKVTVPMEFSMRDGTTRQTKTTIDTLVLEPDLGRFLMIWRTQLPLRRNIFEVLECVAGRMSSGWYRARATNKRHYSSLLELALSKKG
jgi:hypothetical protein